MPQCDDSVLITAARDGQVRCHVISSTGELATTKQVACHRDSAHKVQCRVPITPILVHDFYFPVCVCAAGLSIWFCPYVYLYVYMYM